ncbi:MAG: peptidoglycan recognition family protein [Dehalococcoidia bacterium]
MMRRRSRQRLTRRQFLAAATAVMAAGAVGPFLGRKLGSVAALPSATGPPVVKVLTEEVEDRDASLGPIGMAGATFTSAVLKASFPFTHAALHWAAEGPSPAFALRTSPDGRQWSPWHPLDVEAYPYENTRGETFSTLIGSPRHRYVQYQARLPATSVLRRVTVLVLNTIDGPRLPRPAPLLAAASSQPAATPQPPVTTREQWGADESLRFVEDAELWPRAYIPVKKLVVHHTETANDYDNPAAEVRAIYTYHAQTLGWGDIGYNALIGNDGRLYEGRYGREGPNYDPEWGREILSAGVAAGHARSHNYGTAGAAFLGHFQEFDLPTQMYEVLLAYLEFECRRWGIQPDASSDFLRSDDVWTPGLANIRGHRDVTATICPGDKVYALLPELRSELARRLADPAAPTVRAVRGQEDLRPTALSATFTWEGADDTTPAADLTYSYYLEGWRRIPGSADVVYLSGYKADNIADWSGFAKTSQATLLLIRPGHYTFHVRARNALGNASVFEANATFAWSPQHYKSFVPGISKPQ